MPKKQIIYCHPDDYFRVVMAAMLFDAEVKKSDLVDKGQAVIADPNALDGPIDIMLDYRERKEQDGR